MHAVVKGPGAPKALTCEYRCKPLGLDDTQPRLAWQVNDPRRGAVQSAYQIIVASSIDLLEVEAPDLWDSGKVESDASAQIAYAGARLRSRQQCHWKVRTWDAAGVQSPWSAPQWWEMGLLRAREWAAQWIGQGGNAPESPLFPCPVLRREWSLPAPVASARLYVTALGLHALHINGQPVSNAAFLPGWTDYRKRIPYHVFDVTALLNAGANAIGATLGTGWYAGHVAWKKQVYGTQPRLLLQLETLLTDGTRHRLVSDDSWNVSTGPLLHSDFLMGETCDLRLAVPGWDRAGFDAAAWQPVAVEPLGDLSLQAHAAAPVHSMAELPSRAMTEPAPGTFVFDFGQNLVGHVRLQIPAAWPAGTTVTLQHAEMLNPDGTLYTTNLRKAIATDRIITNGDAFTWEPHFTFHGFRYASITGCPQPPATGMLTAIVRHSELTFTGSFESSHPLLNQLQHNIQWGQRGNFVEVPTDCPQRDERLGWMGDAQIFCRTACFNADVAAFFTQWMINVVDAQRADGNYTDVAPDVLAHGNSPGWTDAGLIVPWTLYRCYGDQRILERHYESYKRYVACLVQNSKELIGPDEGYGDWLQVDTFTPLDLISTAYLAHSADLLHQIAGVLARRGDARRYATLARRVRRAFNKRFVTPDGRLAGDTQAAYVLALAFDLLPENLRPAAVRHLVHQVEHGRAAVWPYPSRKGHLSTGFLTVNKICDVLARGGRLDLAYKLLLNETYPSWLFPVKNGATTIWERWDGWTPEKGFADPGMNSFNHYAYGAIGEWLYQVVAGLDLAPESAGYTHVRLHPHLPPQSAAGAESPLTHAAATLEAPAGRIHCGWKLAGSKVVINVSLPANTRATVTLPGARAETATEAGGPLAACDGVTRVHDDDDGCTFELAAGTYTFTWPRA